MTAFGPTPSDESEKIVRILRHRDHEATEVLLTGGRTILVRNIAWGIDLGDDCYHVTTNISPSQEEGFDIDFFFTYEVVSICDPATGRELYRSGRDEHIE